MNKLLFCQKCVMDGSAKELVLDKDGVCNFCSLAQKELEACKREKYKLQEVLGHIRYDSINNRVSEKYDVLIGLSGGVDSSTALVETVKLGLRPLCFTIDNGYNDPRADENIMRLVEGLKVPFYRYTIDLDLFRHLQNAFLKAGLINVEIPTDHLLMAASYEMAAKYGIKWIISGGNMETESIMPAPWSYTARDLTHIKDVYRKMTGKKLKGSKKFPLCGLLKFNWYKWVKKIKTVYLLDFLDYNRADSIKMLERDFGYKSYGEKHCENIFTSWFQSFYLFEKFGIDKRKAHYSSLINSGQMTRKEAQEFLKSSPIYPHLGIESKVLKYQKRNHRDFRTDEKWFNRISKVVKILRKYGITRRFSHNCS